MLGGGICQQSPIARQSPPRSREQFLAANINIAVSRLPAEINLLIIDYGGGRGNSFSPLRHFSLRCHALARSRMPRTSPVKYPSALAQQNDIEERRQIQLKCKAICFPPQSAPPPTSPEDIGRVYPSRSSTHCSSKHKHVHERFVELAERICCESGCAGTV